MISFIPRSENKKLKSLYYILSFDRYSKDYRSGNLQEEKENFNSNKICLKGGIKRYIKKDDSTKRKNPKTNVVFL